MNKPGCSSEKAIVSNPANVVPEFQWLDATDIPRLVSVHPGSYLLVISLERPFSLSVGRLSARTYESGWYLYAGSALRGLKSRLARYTRRERKKHWHIDYLLDHADVLGVYTIEDTMRYECILARGLAQKTEAVSGFGSSDCRCSGHLFHFKEEECMRAAITFTLHKRFFNRTK